MEDYSALEKRLVQIEEKLDRVLANPSMTDAKGRRVASGKTTRIFWGLFVLVLGLIWLGQSFNIEWLNDLKFWPLAVIAFGLYLMFGARSR